MKKKVLQFAVAAASILLMYYCYITIRFYPVLRANRPPEYPELVKFNDIFWIPFASCLFLNLFRRAVRMIFSSIWAPYCKDQNDPEMLHMRIEKTCLNTYKTIFFSVGSVWGYLIIKDTPIYPSDMGGPNSWGVELLD